MTAKFPTSVVGYASADLHRVTDLGISVLNGAITAGGTSLTVVDATQAVLWPTDNFVLRIENELLYVTTRSGNVCTIGARGFAGTTAASHANTTEVRVVEAAENITREQEETIAIQGVLLGSLAPSQLRYDGSTGRLGISASSPYVPAAPLDVETTAVFSSRNLTIGAASGHANERGRWSYGSNRVRLTASASTTLGFGTGGIDDLVTVSLTGDVTLSIGALTLTAGGVTAQGLTARAAGGVTAWNSLNTLYVTLTHASGFAQLLVAGGGGDLAISPGASGDAVRPIGANTKLGNSTNRWSTVYGAFADFSSDATVGGNLALTGTLNMSGNLSLNISTATTTFGARAYTWPTATPSAGNVLTIASVGAGVATLSWTTAGITQAAADARYVLKAGDTMTGGLTITSGAMTLNGGSLFVFGSLQLTDSTGTTTFGSRTYTWPTAALPASGLLKTTNTGALSWDTTTYLSTSVAAATYLALAGGTMTGDLTMGGSTSITIAGGNLSVNDGSVNVFGNLNVTLSTGTTTFGSRTYTWPTAALPSSGLLKTNASGALSWDTTAYTTVAVTDTLYLRLSGGTLSGALTITTGGLTVNAGGIVVTGTSTFNNVVGFLGTNVSFAASTTTTLGGTTYTWPTAAPPTLGFLKTTNTGALSWDSNTYLTTGSASSTYVLKAGDTMTGSLTLSTGSVTLNGGNLNVFGNINVTDSTAKLTIGGLQYTWPTSQSAGTFLTTNGSGVLSWGTANTPPIAGPYVTWTATGVGNLTNYRTMVNGLAITFDTSTANVLTIAVTPAGLNGYFLSTTGLNTMQADLLPAVNGTYAVGTTALRWSSVATVALNVSGVATFFATRINNDVHGGIEMGPQDASTVASPYLDFHFQGSGTFNQDFNIRQQNNANLTMTWSSISANMMVLSSTGLVVTGRVTTTTNVAVGTSLTVGTTLGVTGAATLSSTLAVTGASTFNAAVTVNGFGVSAKGITSLNGGALTIQSTVASGSKLGVINHDGVDVYFQNLSTGGFQFQAPVFPNVTTTYSLGTSSLRWSTVYGQFADFTSDASIGGNLTLTGTANISGNLSMNISTATTTFGARAYQWPTAAPTAGQVLTLNVVGSPTTLSWTTPFSQATADGRYVLKAGDTMTGSLTVLSAVATQGAASQLIAYTTAGGTGAYIQMYNNGNGQIFSTGDLYMGASGTLRFTSAAVFSTVATFNSSITVSSGASFQSGGDYLFSSGGHVLFQSPIVWQNNRSRLDSGAFDGSAKHWWRYNADNDTDLLLNFERVGANNYKANINGSWLSISDARVKRDVASITNALETVRRLRGTTYRRVGGSALESGFIAQEVEDVLPHLVNGRGEDLRSLNYDAVIPYLVEAVKELAQKVYGA